MYLRIQERKYIIVCFLEANKWVLSNLSFSNFNFIPQIQERMKNWEHGSNPSGTTLLEINNVEKLKWKSWVKQGIPKRIISFISVPLDKWLLFTLVLDRM